MPVHHVVIGNLNIDITIFIERIPGPDESSKADRVVLNVGGAAVNYSVAASRYGHKSHLVGITSRLFEKMGLLEEIQRKGVDTSSVAVVRDGMPGISIILQPPGGQRRIISYRGVNTTLSPEMVRRGISNIPQAKIIQFSSTPPHLLANTDIFFGERLVAYDPGTEVDVERKLFLEAIGKTDILFLNEAEALRFFGENYIEELLQLSYERIIVIKRGARGAYGLYKGEKIEQESIRVRAIDTTGAGDAFNAYFNATYVDTGEIETSLKKAVIAGALKTLRRGSAEAPYRDEVEEYFRKL